MDRDVRSTARGRLSAVLILLLAAGLASCGGGDKDPGAALAGTWTMTQQTPQGAGVTTLSLERGGAYTYQVTFTSSLEERGRWTATSDRLSLTPDGCATRDAAAGTCPTVYTYKLDGSTLTLTYASPLGPSVTVTMTRK